ncbi:MAG TPA: TspO/MBR family protein [Chloroflexota bacterium]|jgi:tryptophan-rich sensory protein
MRGGKDLIWLVAFLVSTFAAAVLGGGITGRSVSAWYPTLRKPGCTPPNWVFGPVWAVLYASMGISAWLVTRAAGRAQATATVGQQAMVAWGLQLALNVAWSAVFFGQRRIGAAVAVIVALWTAIAVCVERAAWVSRPAALLLLPYLAWTTFAAVLNVRIWQLNPPTTVQEH